MTFLSWQPRVGGARRLHEHADGGSRHIIERYLACSLFTRTQPTRSKKLRG